MGFIINTLVYLLIVPVLLFIVVRKIDKRYHVGGDIRLLALACTLFALAMFYPTPLIHGQNTQFTTHLIGGGVMVGLLWIYFMPLMRKWEWWQQAIMLYVAVSALGVLNELYELFAYEIGMSTVPLTDTSWDLFANTLGALIVYIVYWLVKTLFKQR